MCAGLGETEILGVRARGCGGQQQDGQNEASEGLGLGLGLGQAAGEMDAQAWAASAVGMRTHGWLVRSSLVWAGVDEIAPSRYFMNEPNHNGYDAMMCGACGVVVCQGVSDSTSGLCVCLSVTGKKCQSSGSISS